MSSQEWAERAEAAEVSGDEHYAEYCLARHMETLTNEREAEDLARFYAQFSIVEQDRLARSPASQARSNEEAAA